MCPLLTNATHGLILNCCKKWRKENLGDFEWNICHNNEKKRKESCLLATTTSVVQPFVLFSCDPPMHLTLFAIARLFPINDE